MCDLNRKQETLSSETAGMDQEPFCEFSYTLTQREAFDGLRLSGIYKTSGKRAVIETGVLILCFFLFFLSYFLCERETFNLVMSFVSLGLILGLVSVPRLSMYRHSRESGGEIHIRLYEDRFLIGLPKDLKEVLLDGSASGKLVGKRKELLTFLLSEGGLLVLPVRAIPEEKREKAVRIFLKKQDRYS